MKSSILERKRKKMAALAEELATLKAEEKEIMKSESLYPILVRNLLSYNISFSHLDMSALAELIAANADNLRKTKNTQRKTPAKVADLDVTEDAYQNDF